MLKNLVLWQYKINNKEYKLYCDNDSPLCDLKEVAYQLQLFIGKIEDAARENKAKEDAEQAVNFPVQDDSKAEELKAE